MAAASAVEAESESEPGAEPGAEPEESTYIGAAYPVVPNHSYVQRMRCSGLSNNIRGAGPLLLHWAAAGIWLAAKGCLACQRSSGLPRRVPAAAVALANNSVPGRVRRQGKGIYRVRGC